MTVETSLEILDDAATLFVGDTELADPTPVEEAGAEIFLTVADLEAMIDSLDKKAPPLEQIRFNNGAGNVISKLVFNTVTTLFVGEKIMIEMPTWFFPGGAGPYSFTSNMISHGEPTPPRPSALLSRSSSTSNRTFGSRSIFPTPTCTRKSKRSTARSLSGSCSMDT